MIAPENVLEYKNYRQYTWSWLPITDTGLGFRKNLFCNHVIIKNMGTSTMIINGIYNLLAGEILTLPGYPGEIGTHIIEITFDTAPGNKKLGAIITKNYPNI